MKKCHTILTALIIVLVLCSWGEAVDKYDASNYETWDQTLQCYTFVNMILQSEGRGSLPAFADIEGESNRGNTSDTYYGRYYPTDSKHLVGKILNDEFRAANDRYPDASDVKAIFDLAQVGDVVQMYFDTDSAIQHTAIIAKKLDDGVQFLHANYDVERDATGKIIKGITNKGPDTFYDENGEAKKYFAYWHFSDCCNRPGDAGGFSIYHYESSTSNNTSIEGTYTAVSAKAYVFFNDDYADGSLSEGNLSITFTNTSDNKDRIALSGTTSFTNYTTLNLQGRDMVFARVKNAQNYTVWNTIDPFFIDSVGRPPTRVSANHTIEQTGSDTIKLQINEKYGSIEINFKRTGSTASSITKASAVKENGFSGLSISKEKIKASAADGYMWIDGVADDSPYYLYENHSGTGWAWNADDEKLTLNSNYGGKPIFISSFSSEAIKIEVNGNVTIDGGEYGSPIKVEGSVNVIGTGTINLVPSELAAQYSIPTIQATGDVIFSGASLTASAEEELNCAVASDYGDVILQDSGKVTAKAKGTQGYAVYSSQSVILNGDASLTAEGEGKNSAGILAKYGDIIVSDNASLTAKGIGEGYAVEIREGELIANNDNVELYADDQSHTTTTDNTGSGEVQNHVNQDEDNQKEEDDKNEDDQNKNENNSVGNSGGGCGVFINFAWLLLLPAAIKIKVSHFKADK